MVQKFVSYEFALCLLLRYMHIHTYAIHGIPYTILYHTMPRTAPVYVYIYNSMMYGTSITAQRILENTAVYCTTR